MRFAVMLLAYLLITAPARSELSNRHSLASLCETPAGCKAPKVMPPLMLWAWEAPQDLRSIDIRTTGVASLILTIRFHQGGVEYYTRQQPLHVPPGTYTIAVVHIGNLPKNIHPGKALAHYWAAKIRDTWLRRSSQELQIDFDATTSQQPFYQELLLAVREAIGSEAILSITGLASWCTNDRWIGNSNLPVNYVVPMFFSLDTNARRRERFIRAFDSRYLAPWCQGPIGLTTRKDWDVPILTRQPVFVYHTGTWTRDALLKAYALRAQHQSTSGSS